MPKKAYDSINGGCMLKILEAYGVGPNLSRLQNSFWQNAKLVCRAGGSYRSPFAAFQGVTQGGPLSLLMFNVCVDAVVREWLHQTLGDDTARQGIGDEVAKWMVTFYIDDGLVSRLIWFGCNLLSIFLSVCLNALDSLQMQPR